MAVQTYERSEEGIDLEPRTRNYEHRTPNIEPQTFPMSSELLQIAIAGLDRRDLPADKDWPADWPPCPARPEARLLLQAGLEAWARRRQPLASGPLAPPALAPAETQPYLPAAATELLSSWLRQPAPALLAEFLQLTVAHGYILPPQLLPALLRRAVSTDLDDTLLLRAGGARLLWLAAQHPDWRYLLPPQAADGDSPDPSRRRAWLAALRAQDPAAGRAYWEHRRPQEKGPALAQLTLLLQIGLEPADEPLLEGLLTHRQQAVRAVAIDLLASLPESALVARAKGHLAACLTWEGDDLHVSPPAQLTTALRADGAGLIALPTEALGRRATWLCQLLSVVPPTHWSTTWGRSPQQLVQQASAHEWAQPLILGWLLATLRHPEAGWAMALSRLLARDLNRERPLFLGLSHQTHLRPLLAAVPPPERHAWLQRILPQTQHLHHLQALLKLLQAWPETLPPSLAQDLAYRLTQVLDRYPQAPARGDTLFLHQLSQLARLWSPDQYPRLLGMWASDPFRPPWYAPFLQDCLDRLALRYRLHQAFAPSASG